MAQRLAGSGIQHRAGDAKIRLARKQRRGKQSHSH
jgi:hypothetical protein